MPACLIRKYLVCYGLGLLSMLPAGLFAEGSKELTANGGYRAFLLSGTAATTSFPFPTLGTMKVYVKAGEIIYAGSSAQGVNAGTINLRAPDGSTYTSGNSTTIGFINNRSQELAGPQPNAGGYTPYTRIVSNNQEGIWEVDFVSPSNGMDVGSAPFITDVNANWIQPSGQYIAAFDVSVRNAANTSFLTGRVFTNIFSGYLSSFAVGFNAALHILTKDGYQYILDNDGQAGNGFSFFVNNKGFRNSGSATYQSVNSTTNPNVQDPRAADTQSDITHKIFFNTPASDLPATANTPGGGTTWLANPPFVPTLSNVGFTGVAGIAGKASTAVIGGTINFTAAANGNYVIVIDANQNGVYTDALDRKLTGTVNAGNNQVSWDGLDGNGNKFMATPASYNVNISLSLYGAEVHFPFFDVERNVNGIILTRTNGVNLPNDTVYWDDSAITIIGTPSNPVKNSAGSSSAVNGHKWGSPTLNSNDETDFGNNKSIDTWAYVMGTPLVAVTSFQVLDPVFPTDTPVPNIITPNGDGKNDVLVIKDLSFFPGSQLLIFNRWGNEVYRSENYANNWNGSGLADGTYFYILNRKEKSGSITTLKGWIYLKR